MKLGQKLRRGVFLALLTTFLGQGAYAAGPGAATVPVPAHAATPGRWLGLSLVQLVGELGSPEEIFYIHKEKGSDGLMIMYLNPSRLFETDGRGVVDRVYEPPE